MDSKNTVLFAILAAAILVAAFVGAAVIYNSTDDNDSSDTAFNVDVWKKNSDTDDKNADALSVGRWVNPPKFDSEKFNAIPLNADDTNDAFVVNSFRPIPDFYSLSVADSNEKVTPDWYVDMVFEKKTRSTWAVFSLEFVVELFDGAILYGGPMYYPGLTNVHHGSSLFAGTMEEFQQYVVANVCEWELPSKEYTFP